MSTSPPTPPTPALPSGVVKEAAPPPAQSELKIVSHSNLFYWWPVWAIGFLMGVLSLIDNHRMAILPPDIEVKRDWRVVVGQDPDGKDVIEPREGVLVKKSDKPTDQHHLPPNVRDSNNVLVPPDSPHLVIANNKVYGVIWAVTLLLVIVITNVPMRGLWSLLVIVTVILLTIIFWLAGWWEYIFGVLKFLDIRLNTGGYFFISGLLFGLWMLTFLFFDRQQYIIFSPGSVRVCTEIGGGETAYDSSGLRFEKKRSDLFRHWILGFGSGDLIVKTTGAAVDHFDLPNVLFIGRKVEMIEHMIREKAVVGRR